MNTRAPHRQRLPLLAALFAASAIASFAQEIQTTHPVHFRAVDVFVDPEGKPLAAYQLEFTIIGGNAKIVGIEGGEHPAFKEPPHYDPKAIQNERVIIGAFSTEKASALPKGRTRVATIHLRSEGDAVPEFESQATAAADSRGRKIKTKVTLKTRKGE